MSVVPLQVFVSLLLVASSLVLFLFTVRQRDLDHADRLSLAPLEDDVAPKPGAAEPSPCSGSQPRPQSGSEDHLPRSPQ